jgi:Calcineurin-like phosphoesterase
MSVAVITDPHANLPALEASLGRIDEPAVESVYCGGDLVGYGPHPNEVCALGWRGRSGAGSACAARGDQPGAS